MSEIETNQQTFESRALASRNWARKHGRYVSEVQIIAELKLMLKKAKRSRAARTPLGSPPR